MFEVLREPARRAIELAQAQAREMNHNYIGTEHLLLALTMEDLGPATHVLAMSGITNEALRSQAVQEIGVGDTALTDDDAEALAAIGIDLQEVRHRIEKAFGPGALIPSRPCKKGRLGYLAMTRRSKRALELSHREATRMGDDHIGPEHILLALLEDNQALSVELIRRLGSTPELVRERMLAALDKDS
jgi:ATP-dependent Clp protease ATP-binding subunit ClpA